MNSIKKLLGVIVCLICRTIVWEVAHFIVEKKKRTSNNWSAMQNVEFAKLYNRINIHEFLIYIYILLLLRIYRFVICLLSVWVHILLCLFLLIYYFLILLVVINFCSLFFLFLYMLIIFIFLNNWGFFFSLEVWQ